MAGFVYDPSMQVNRLKEEDVNVMDDIRIRTGSDDVTEAESVAVIAWCRDWASDCEWADIEETNELDDWDVPSLLRNCDKHIDGGLAFVLADVRRCADSRATLEASDKSSAERRAERRRLYGDMPLDAVIDATAHVHPMVAKSDVASLNERYKPWEIVHAKVALPEGSQAWPWETQARNTSTGEIIYRCEGWSKASRGQALNAILERRVNDDAPNPIIATFPASDGGTIREYKNGMHDAIDGVAYSLSPGFESRAELEAWIADWIYTSDRAEAVAAYRKLGNASRVVYRPNDDKASSGEPYVMDYIRAREVADSHRGYCAACMQEDHCGASDCEWADIEETNEIGSMIDAEVSRVAASMAREAASSFEVDEDREDAESAAQRVADILRDMNADVPHGFDEWFKLERGVSAPMRPEVASFLTRIFGLPAEDRHACKRLASVTAETVRTPEGIERMREWRKDARRERGLSEVARVLVFEYRDIIMRVVFAGHESFTDATGREFGESTNLSSFREACAAWDALNDLRSHTYGDMSLDGCAGHIDIMGARAIEAIVAACQYAISNAANGDSEDAQEVGMPRAE